MDVHYRFDDFEIDLPKRELRHEAAPVSIKPKDLDVLAYLIRCRDRFATKDELLDQFWPELETFEAVLTSTVSRLRRILGADAIRSIRPCSYRFTRSVNEVVPPPLSTAESVRAPSTADFVGRNNDLARLREAIDTACQGSGGVFLIAGDAGVGKSRLMEEATRYARARGVEALIARAGDENSQIPYYLWKRTLADYAAGRPQTANTGAPSRDAELDWSALESSAPISAGSDSRLAFFEAVSSAFLRAAAAAPLVTAFDDLHAADVASLQLLCFITRRCARTRLLIIGTLRDVEPGTPQPVVTGLATLRRDPRCAFHLLAPFTQSESIDYLEHLGGGVTAGAQAAILASAEGNPFLLRECWRRARDSDGDKSEAAHQPGSDVVADLFGPRLARLSPVCSAVLSVAAACGRELDATLAQRSSGYSPSEFADAIDEARRARFIVAVRGRSTQLRFSHQLVRDFIYERCPAELRRQVHRRAAEILEAECGDDPGERLAELAVHWEGAIDEGCAERAIERIQELSDWMGNRLGFEDAIGQLERCLALIDRYRPSWEARRWQIYLLLAYLYQRLGDQVAADRALDRMRQTLGPQSPPAGGRSGSALRLFATLELGVELPRDIATGEIDRPVLPPPQQRASIVGLRMATNGLERARRHGDAAIVASELAQICWRIQDVCSAERLAQSAELLALARAGRDRDFEQEARLLRVHYLLVSGDIGGVDAEIAAFGAALTQTPDPLYLWLHKTLLAMRTHLEGRFAESEAYVYEAAAAGVGLPSALTERTMSMQLFAIRTSQGNTAELLPILEMILAISQTHQSALRGAIAAALCELERFDEARAHLGILSANRFRAVFDSPVTWFATAVGLARVCDRLAARREAAVLYAAILPYASTCVASPLPLNCYGATAGYLALLAGAMGQKHKAASHFDAALATNQRLRAWPAVAHTQFEYARLLLRGTRTPRARGRHLLRQARITAVDLEMSGLVKWIDAVG